MTLRSERHKSELIIVSDARFYYGHWGVMGECGRFGQGFFEEAYAVFDSVSLVARMQRTVAPPRRDCLLSGPFKLFSLPSFRGGKGYMVNFLPLLYKLYLVSKLRGVFVLRLPSFITLLLFPFLVLRRRQYAVEVIGFAGDALKSTGSRVLVVFASIMETLTRLICSRACAISYVTSHEMPSAFPCPGKAFIIAGTRVRDFSLRAPRVFEAAPNPIKLLHIGTMNTLYKGQSILLESICRLLSYGIMCNCTFVGDGPYKEFFEEKSRMLDLSSLVKFIGAVPGGSAIADLMDSHDILVVNSLTEGLPNIIIEGMMRGIPIIASGVGGIPELIEPDCLVEPGEVKCLTETLRALSTDSDKLTALSERSIDKARLYMPDILIKKRHEFYQYVKNFCL